MINYYFNDMRKSYHYHSSYFDHFLNKKYYLSPMNHQHFLQIILHQQQFVHLHHLGFSYLLMHISFLVTIHLFQFEQQNLLHFLNQFFAFHYKFFQLDHFSLLLKPSSYTTSPYNVSLNHHHQQIIHFNLNTL